MARSAISKVQLRKSGGFTVQGYNELIDNLNTVIDRTTAEKLKSGFLAGAMIVRDAAKANAPDNKKRKTGYHLKEAVFAAPGKKTASDTLVGVSRSRRKTGSPSAPHGILVHEGTQDRKTKSGANRGRVVANPFFKRAVEQTKGKVAAKIVDTMKVAVFGGIK